MAWIAFTTDGAEKSPIIKFFDEETYAKMKEALNVEPGDLVLFAADTAEVANAVLSALRLHMAEALNIPREGHALLWVVNFPMFRYDADEKKYAAEHHPFTMVPPEQQHLIEEAPLECGNMPTTWSWTALNAAAVPFVSTPQNCSAVFCVCAA